MKAKLVVVESPAKARTIAKYLGPEYLIRATEGHVIDLALRGKGNLGVDVGDGFTPFYAVLPEKKDRVAAIKDSASMASEVFLATDPHREGEAIAWHVASQLPADLPKRRVEFHEITKKGVLAGMAAPRPLDLALFDAQQARRVIDRLVGFLVSPWLGDAVGPKLSAGRVQSVALRLLAERERQIGAFEPEDYWVVRALGDGFVAKHTKRLKTREEADKVAAAAASGLVVARVQGKKNRKAAPPPLTTSRLQQLAARRYRMTSEACMAAAQSLYEQGAVTYIRTDSVRVSDESVKQARQWVKAAGLPVPKKIVAHANKSKAQDGHEAIRPTMVDVIPRDFKGGDAEKKIYRLVWETFVGSQMGPLVIENLSLRFKAGAFFFEATGQTVLEKGWQAVSSEQEKDALLPSFGKGDKVIPSGVDTVASSTRPPPRLNDGTLVAELEKREVGRPSTYSGIVPRLMGRNYVKREGDAFAATPLGQEVVEALSSHFSFMDYAYTRTMEERLDKVAAGDDTYLIAVSDFYRALDDELRAARSSLQRKSGHPCPECKAETDLRHGSRGYYVRCSTHPDCSFSRGARLEKGEVVLQDAPAAVPGVACPKCEGEMFRRDGKFGPFYSCMSYPRCFGKRKIPWGGECPECKKNSLYLTLVEGELGLGCMGFPFCRHTEPLPRGTAPEWVDPRFLGPTSRPPSLEQP